jgi:TMEM175 potassium channel family protein
MSKTRLEAFSDGVIAILITIMVLELRAPEGTDLEALRPLVPTFLAYLLSFIYLGIYWNNHHHMLQATRHISGGILWPNLHLLFWLSLVPFVTSWMGEHHLAAVPTAVYGVVMLCCAVAWWILQNCIVAVEGPDSTLAAAVGKDLKAKVSLGMYAAAVALAFVQPWIADALYATVAVIWLVPDRRIESKLSHRPKAV